MPMPPMWMMRRGKRRKKRKRRRGEVKEEEEVKRKKRKKRKRNIKMNKKMGMRVNGTIKAGFLLISNYKMPKSIFSIFISIYCTIKFAFFAPSSSLFKPMRE
jgi:hypothetical protein